MELKEDDELCNYIRKITSYIKSNNSIMTHLKDILYDAQYFCTMDNNSIFVRSDKQALFIYMYYTNDTLTKIMLVPTIYKNINNVTIQSYNKIILQNFEQIEPIKFNIHGAAYSNNSKKWLDMFIANLK